MNAPLNPTAKTTGVGQPAEAKTVREIVRERTRGTGFHGDWGWFTAEEAADLYARLDLGEQTYSQPLKLGWAGARQELYQEVLDAVLYAISAQDYSAVHKLLPVLHWLQPFELNTENHG